MQDKQTWMFPFAQGKHNDLFACIEKVLLVNKNRAVIIAPLSLPVTGKTGPSYLFVQI